MAGRIPTSEIRKRMSEALNMLSEPDQWVIITRRGDPVAAMVSVNLLWRLLEQSNRPGRRLTYSVPGQSDGPVETACTAAPEQKSGTGPSPWTSPHAKPVEIEIDDPALPELDELLVRIEALREATGLEAPAS